MTIVNATGYQWTCVPCGAFKKGFSTEREAQEAGDLHVCDPRLLNSDDAGTVVSADALRVGVKYRVTLQIPGIHRVPREREGELGHGTETPTQ